MQTRCLSCLFHLMKFPVCFQSKEFKNQNEQLVQVNASLGSEVDKLQKQLEQVRSLQVGGGQLTSLQEELEKLREELQEASEQRKKLEKEHGTEKLELQQVRADKTPGVFCRQAGSLNLLKQRENMCVGEQQSKQSFDLHHLNTTPDLRGSKSLPLCVKQCVCCF